MKTLQASQFENLRDRLSFEPRLALIDSHIHLDAKAYAEDWESCWSRAKTFGLVAAVLPATNVESSRRIVSMCQQKSELYGAVGIHPHQAEEFDAAVTPGELESLVPQACAIGETGLEAHYDFCPWESQLLSLRYHLKLAQESKLPVILHCRDCEDALYDELKAVGDLPGGGVVHCFTGGWQLGQRFLDLGFHLGVNGIVTIANAEAVHELARQMPLDRMLLETDGPYLTPKPFRGIRNESALVPLVCQEVARLRDCSVEEVAAATSRNSKGLFGLRLEV